MEYCLNTLQSNQQVMDQHRAPQPPHATQAQYFKRMVDLNQVTKFKGSFPRNASDVWGFGLRLLTYKNDNIKVGEDVLMKQVLDRVNNDDKTQWTMYFNEKVQALVSERERDPLAD
eukprot:95990_1